MKNKEQKLVDIIGVCDVWDGNKEVGRGLYYSAEKCGLDAQGKDKDASPRTIARSSTARTSTPS